MLAGCSRATCSGIQPGEAPVAPRRLQPSAATLRSPSSSTELPQQRTALSGSVLNVATDLPNVRICDVTAADYWAVADMHCDAFYPRAGGFWDPLLRLDRVMSLQIGRERDDVQNVGRFACLAAYDTRARDALPTSSAPIDLGLLVGTIVQLLLPPSMRQNCGANHVAAGVLGAVVLDTMLEHVPPKKNAIVNGRVVPEATRARMAYLSNLAVSPRARRRKVGLALLRRAEAVAVEWGCRSMALHVDPENEAAVRLYEGAGYRFVARQPEWQRLLEGRSNALTLMLRVLPRKGSAGVDADAAL